MAKNLVDLRKKEARFLKQSAKNFERKQKAGSSLYAKRVRAKMMIAVVIFALLAGIFYGVYWLSYHPRLSIQEVEINGDESIPASDIREIVNGILNNNTWQYISPRNIFLYPREDIVDAILVKYPRIRSVTVGRDSLLSQTLDVTIDERAPFAQWCNDTDCYLLDISGFIYADATSTRKMPYTFTGYFPATSTVIGRTFAGVHMFGIKTLLDQLSQAGYTPTQIAILSDDDFTVQLQDSFYLKLSFGEDVNSVVRDLQLVLASPELKDKEDQIEYIDLRFGDRVYYKLKGEAEVGPQQ